MKIAIFGTHEFERPFLLKANITHQHELVFFNSNLSVDTAALAKDFTAVSCFVTDKLDAKVLNILADNGIKLITLRSAGFDHIDLTAAKNANLIVTRVPRYSPYAVAEFAVGLIQCLNRKIHLAHNRIQQYNFALDGLLGFDLHDKVVGVIGTGEIGSVFSKIMLAFGCKVIAHDLLPRSDCITAGIKYVSLNELYQQSDIISLHCPLTTTTHHLINKKALQLMKSTVMLINTGRGALLDTVAVIDALEKNKIAYLGLDVYEYEANLFFRDLSNTVIHDELFVKLQTFSNVLITGHQAFFTQEALIHIAQTTLQNVTDFATDLKLLYKRKVIL